MILPFIEGGKNRTRLSETAKQNPQIRNEYTGFAGIIVEITFRKGYLSINRQDHSNNRMTVFIFIGHIFG